MTNLEARRTKKGIVSTTFAHMKERCVKYDRELSFTRIELLDWCIKQKMFHTLFNKWVKANYIKDLKPSIDRLDPLKGYSFDNIRITTYKINRTKGDKEKDIIWGKPIILCDQFGNHIKKFHSLKQAALELNINSSKIGEVLRGVRKKVGEYYFIADENIINSYNKRYQKIKFTDTEKDEIKRLIRLRTNYRKAASYYKRRLEQGKKIKGSPEQLNILALKCNEKLFKIRKIIPTCKN